MEEVRDRDFRVPLISCLIFICLIAGGGFLVVYVFLPNLSQPWFATAALALIGVPLGFWAFMYLYTCAKACLRRRSLDDRQISRRSSRTTIPTAPSSRTATAPAAAAAASACTTPKSAGHAASSPHGQPRHVHFGGGEDGERGESSVESRESEMPLTLSASS